MRQQQPTKILTRRFWIGLMLSTLPLSGCSIGLQHDLNSEKAQMEKKPTVAQWSTQLNKVENQLIAHYHATYPTMQVTKDSSPAELTCSLMPHSDIGGGNITIEGAGEWSRWDTGNYPKGVTASTLEAAMARYYAPLGFHVTVIKGVSYPAQISGPGNATVDFNDDGANGWAIHVEAGCRMYTHSHSNAPATKD